MRSKDHRFVRAEAVTSHCQVAVEAQDLVARREALAAEIPVHALGATLAPMLAAAATFVIERQEAHFVLAAAATCGSGSAVGLEDTCASRTTLAG
jgi:hypothetical protein